MFFLFLRPGVALFCGLVWIRLVVRCGFNKCVDVALLSGWCGLLSGLVWSCSMFGCGPTL